MSLGDRILRLAVPRGFCAGVRRALDMAEKALREPGPPVYGYNEIVHNRHVVSDLAGRGLQFVHDLEDVPFGARVLFSAHGVSPVLRAQARARGLAILDATCPFVQKVHAEVRRFAHEGYTILLIGKRGHDEVVGIAGEVPEQIRIIETLDDVRAIRLDHSDRVAVVTQTTLSLAETRIMIDALRTRFPALRCSPETDICHATTLRQEAVRLLSARVEHVLVLGSRNSSNTLRLMETARQSGVSAALIETVADLESEPLESVRVLGLTAGASTPDRMIARVVEALVAMGFQRADDVGKPDGIETLLQDGITPGSEDSAVRDMPGRISDRHRAFCTGSRIRTAGSTPLRIT